MFTYELTEDGKVQIYRFNKPVKILKGVEAAKFTEKASKMNFDDAQTYLAKITG